MEPEGRRKDSTPCELIYTYVFVSDLLREFDRDALMKPYPVPDSWKCGVDQMTPIQCALWFSHEEAFDYLIRTVPPDYIESQFQYWIQNTDKHLLLSKIIDECKERHEELETDLQHRDSVPISGPLTRKVPVPECWLKRCFLLEHLPVTVLKSLSSNRSIVPDEYQRYNYANFLVGNDLLQYTSTRCQVKVSARSDGYEVFKSELDTLTGSVFHVSQLIFEYVWGKVQNKLYGKVAMWLNLEKTVRLDLWRAMSMLYDGKDCSEEREIGALEPDLVTVWLRRDLDVALLYQSIHSPGNFLVSMHDLYTTMLECTQGDEDDCEPQRNKTHNDILVHICSCNGPLAEEIFPSGYQSPHLSVMAIAARYSGGRNNPTDPEWNEDPLRDKLHEIDSSKRNYSACSPK